jgi:NAD(P)H-nitrite reductase large subunit
MKTLVVGSGLAGVTVAEALAKSARHEVVLATTETHGYYSRPRLSHGVALADAAAAKIVMKRFGELASGVRVLPGVEVQAIDRNQQHARLGDGTLLEYDVLVLATGSAARIPGPLLASRPHFFTLNSFEDLVQLRARRAQCLARGARPRWAVIGGGLIGCEVASDLHKAGDAVVIFHREARLLELLLAENQSHALHAHFAARDVQVRYNQDVKEIAPNAVVTTEGEAGGFDGIIVSTGFAPRIALAQQAGLATARGIVVNEFLRTADPCVYAAGDVAEVGGRLYAFVSPIRSQALWLAEHLEGRSAAPWVPPAFKPVMKIHDFKLEQTPHSVPLQTG